jgi:hypothetical protein
MAVISARMTRKEGMPNLNMMTEGECFIYSTQGVKTVVNEREQPSKARMLSTN